MERGVRTSRQAQLLLLNEAVCAWPPGKEGPCRERRPESVKSTHPFPVMAWRAWRDPTVDTEERVTPRGLMD